MNALKELKKQATQWLPVESVLKFKTLGELYSKQPPPLIVLCRAELTPRF
tara:strand:+ start:693 stop:842 length:150 start_codon:yes stop_codon:yes gene_type:complete